MTAGEGKGKGPPAVDLVVWHVVDRVLELLADMGFTEYGAAVNALAREIALNSAKRKLLEVLEDLFAHEDRGRRHTPTGADDPAVIEFVARFRANLVELVEEASSATATFSTRHPRLPDDVEDRLRENAARSRRQQADEKEYWRLSDEYKAAVQSRNNSEAAGEGSTASPAPAGDNVPDMPRCPQYGDDPILPDPLAASPPRLVLRPMDDLFRVFTVAEIMVAFSKVILSRRDCILCPGYEIWFEKKRAVKKNGVVRHEYAYKTGKPYC